MKFNKILAGVLACCVIGGALPYYGELANNSTIVALADEDEENDYTEGTYESLKYINYGDYIEISGYDNPETDIVIPAEIGGVPVTSIGDYAFVGFQKTTKITITIPNSVTSIGDYAFCECSSFKNIIIPDSVTSIGESAFRSCSLKEIIIPNSVTSIGESAFIYSALTKITLPNSVTKIGDSAFFSCSDLKEITILNPNCEIGDSYYTIANAFNDDVSFYDFDGTIYGYENSTAQEYAERYNRKFVALSTEPEIAMGDVNGDDTIDSSDATDVLVDYSLTSTGKESQLTDAQKAAADIDKDGKIDSSDASFILQFYAYTSTGGKETDMSKWMGN